MIVKGDEMLKKYLKMSKLDINPAEPLWQRIPKRTDDGQYLNDFMMVIPGLSKKPEQIIEKQIVCLHNILSHYQQFIVFAEFNPRLNVLWVSMKPVQGLIMEIASAIKQYIPEAALIGHQGPEY